MNLYRQSKNSKYDNKFLIWAVQLYSLRANDSYEYVNWYVNDTLDKVFTRESILEAIDNRLGRYCPYDWDNTYFIEIDYDDLEEYVGDSVAIDKQDMIAWLQDQLTDMDKYDPRSEMDEGEHIFGALARREAREQDNHIINAIIKELKKL